jgi:U3 small nucleolar RNA-associated protein 4
MNFARERLAKRKLDRLGLPADDELDDDATANGVVPKLPHVAESPRTESDGDLNGDVSLRPFWITFKYRPILVADTLGAGELAVIERPLFDVPKSRAFWSNHLIRM